MLRIATRKSPLALWQANYVKETILQAHPSLSVEILSFWTEGDKKLDVSLTKIGGKGLFVKELEAALLSQEADIAVHSIKDMPVEQTPGLVLVAICEREDPRDVLVTSGHLNGSKMDNMPENIVKAMTIKTLPPGAVIGTSSSRRACLLRNLRADVAVKPLRGNVGTRLKKLDDGEFDAIILAAAGLKRLEESHRICDYLATRFWTPAVGQGAIGIECREDQVGLLMPLLSSLDHQPTRLCITAERSFNAALGGGCQLPIAAHAICVGDQLHMSGFIAHPEKNLSFRAELAGSRENPEQLGKDLAALLLQKGGEDILREMKMGLK